MTPPDTLFRLPSARRRDPRVELWFEGQSGDLAAIARHWFEIMRGCGEDVRELMHDGCPTLCVGDAAFAYVGVYRAHVSIGFFRGAALDDPRALLEGAGKFMRHVKLRREKAIDHVAVSELIEAAYLDMKQRVSHAPE